MRQPKTAPLRRKQKTTAATLARTATTQATTATTNTFVTRNLTIAMNKQL